ncbi:TIGR02594 family protein [Mesorhizobium sp. M5C.F.Ca.IN.020.14.1.1]|nr:TIGR02594 family protein [Mesorhizobium sp. M5C.F.Ca.IN.020.14.1.1]
MSDPAWLANARKYLGQREVRGPQHNPHVLKWWKNMGAPFKDDETPWCGAFVGGVLVETGIRPVAGGASAQAWLKLPVKLDKPAVGAVVVFWRGSPSSGLGHVGFVVGKDQAGHIMVLGGNQGDTVSIKPFSTDRVKGYRWPGVYPYSERFNLPVISSDGRVSTNEA